MSNYRIIDNDFYNNWMTSGRTRSLLRGNAYSIKCDTKEQKDECIRTLEAFCPGANVAHYYTGSETFPVCIRWIRAHHANTIMVVDERDADTFKSFDEVFRLFGASSNPLEGKYGSIGKSIGSDEYEISLMSKRLDGHIITL